MQHTKHAKLAILASVLIAASIFGGLSIAPAMAQVAVAAEEISLADGESLTIEAIELTARTATTRTLGTITVNILQNDTVIDSAELDTDALSMDFDAQRLVVAVERCVGCGLCEQVCRTVNDHIAIKVTPFRWLVSSNS